MGLFKKKREEEEVTEPLLREERPYVPPPLFPQQPPHQSAFSASDFHNILVRLDQINGRLARFNKILEDLNERLKVIEKIAEESQKPRW
jgi:hypothetical protein